MRCVAYHQDVIVGLGDAIMVEWRVHSQSIEKDAIASSANALPFAVSSLRE
jgi:hypothetical protein